MGKRKSIHPYLALCLLLLCLLCGCFAEKKEQLNCSKEAVELMEAGAYAEALEKWEAFLTLDINTQKQRTKALCAGALCHFALENYAGCIQNLQKAESEAALDNEAKALYIIALARQGEELDKALSLLKELHGASERGSAYEEALDELLMALLSAAEGGGSLPESDLQFLEEWSKEEYQKEKTAAAANRMGVFACLSGDYAKGLTYFEEASSMLTDEEFLKKAVLFNQAACYEHLREPEKALELFDTYVSLYGEDERVKHEILFLRSRLHTQ